METARQVAAQLLDGLRAQLPAEGFVLRGFEIELGALVDLPVEDLLVAVEEAWPGIEVRVTVVAAVLRCEDCGAEYPADEHPCPVCGSARAELIHGNELHVKRAWGSRPDGPTA